MNYSTEKEAKLLLSLATEREKFARANRDLMTTMCDQLVEHEVYPKESKLGRSPLEMVENYGIDWHLYREPHFCPHCNADLRSKNGPPYKREIGVVENDRLRYYTCPDCGKSFQGEING